MSAPAGCVSMPNLQTVSRNTELNCFMGETNLLGVVGRRGGEVVPSSPGVQAVFLRRQGAPRSSRRPRQLAPEGRRRVPLRRGARRG